MKSISSVYLTKAHLILVLFIFFTISCQQDNKQTKHQQIQKLFSNIAPNHSGLHFTNSLIESENSNYYQYMYTYIGGGVAAGDINNDGLIDLFFTSNSSQDKLFLNKGNFQFDDITPKSGINNNNGFNTGTTFIDINNDGYLDIYIARGGWKKENNKFANLLYINNQNNTFTEKAAEYGLADSNRTIHATFFDYDNDNDIDVYISNTPDITSKTKIFNLKQTEKNPKTQQLLGNDKLYENDGTGHFTDVSQKAGLLYDIGFGLNPQVGDLNNDGWLDIYVCNDFNVPDLVYINNQDKTFTESRDQLFKHMSFNSMGSDMVDINNDGLLDLMTLDMNPKDYIRSKTTMAMTSIDQFDKMVANGYHHQYMHNMLQLNNGNGSFSEIANMSGIANTDWSWSVLAADFDLDNYNDIYITNGVFRDVIDRDQNSRILKELRKNKRKPTKKDFLEFTKMLPQQKLNNYFFKNKGNLTFEDTSTQWTDSIPTFSNGAIYADLDNDGDLDIVVNNINSPATVLKNNARELKKGNYLKINLKGPKGNNFGLGTTVKVTLNNHKTLTRQLVNSRGFLSSVSNTLHFGISKNDTIKQIDVSWLDGSHQQLNNISPNQTLWIDYSKNNKTTTTAKETIKPLFKQQTTNYKHIDPYFKDYDAQILLPHKLSQTGPAIDKGDINKDGLDDLYIGGGKNQPGRLLLAQKNNTYITLTIPAFVKDKAHEDVAALFFDYDQDGDDDLYVVSGSYEFYRTPNLLQDRLYKNIGNGKFVKTTNVLPKFSAAGSTVISSDYDSDGDLDVFIGSRVDPAKYPHPPKNYLLTNQNGKFSITTATNAPELEHIGMVTSAVWTDLNNDNRNDLIVTGEWMGIETFINTNNKLVRSNNYPTLANTIGWWNKITIADVDNDGDKDIIAGNLGLNYKFKASKKEPFHVYTTDFDFNGTQDIILAKYYKNKEVPVRGKTCMTQQLPHLKNKIPSYTEFANKDLKGILGQRINSSLHYQANEFRSGIFINNEHKFQFQPLPITCQQAPINSIIYNDFDKDGTKDLLMAGNNYMSEVETTRSDAGIGVYMKGNKNGTFTPLSNLESGFFANKDVRNMITVKTSKGKQIWIANNNDNCDIFSLEPNN